MSTPILIRTAIGNVELSNELQSSFSNFNRNITAFWSYEPHNETNKPIKMLEKKKREKKKQYVERRGERLSKI